MPRSGTILITGEKTQESDHISMDPILTGDFSQHSNFLWPEYGVFTYSYKESEKPNIS